MSALSSLFSGQGRVESSEFRYDPNRQKKAPAPQASPFPFQGQAYAFRLDSSTNENKSMGTSLFLIRPASGAYQVLVYQDQNNPYVCAQITPALNFILRNKVYCYFTDQGTQWTIQFSDPSVAARAAISMASILAQADGSKFAFFDLGVGSGPVVSTDDQVVVSYIGFLGNQLPHTQGQFDANENFQFVIGSQKIIKGYSAGVDGMRIDGCRAIIVPPDLGYGPGGAAGVIPPNAVLTFLITLKSANIRPKAAAEPRAAPRAQSVAATLPPQTVAPTLPPQTVAAPVAAPQPRPKPKPKVPDDEPEEPRVKKLSQKETEEMATVDQQHLIERLDALAEAVRSQFESLAVAQPVTMKPGDVVYEVQALAAEIEDKEQRLREQQRLIDELKRTKQNSRLQAELDIAQAELHSLRSMLKGGRDFRRENEELRAALADLREGKLLDMSHTLSDLRIQLARQREIAQQTAVRNAKEMFYGFMGAAVDRVNKRFAGQAQIPTRDLTGTIYDIFHQCSEEVMKQIEERGLV
jgi:hypothetical protein